MALVMFFPLEIGRAARILSKTSGITWQAEAGLLFQLGHTPVGGTFVQFGWIFLYYPLPCSTTQFAVID